MFILPKILGHFQYNADAHGTITTIYVFGSVNAGTVSIPISVFTTGIDETILAKGFKIDIATIKHIKASLAPKA